LEKTEERIATAEVGVLTLINQKLKTLVQLFEQQVPEGVPVNFEDQTVTDQPSSINFVSGPPYHPLFRIDVYNGSGSNVYARVNKSEEIKIKPYRNIPFDYKKAAITKVELRAEVGTTATVDVVGLY